MCEGINDNNRDFKKYCNTKTRWPCICCFTASLVILSVENILKKRKMTPKNILV